MGLRERAGGLLALTRPSNAIAAGALTFVGAFVGGAPLVVPALAAVLATIFATGAGMAINDYLDRDIDAINRPDRPIPSGRVPPTWALAESLFLFALAVALALTLPLVAILIAIINLIALLTYTSLFKGLPGVGNAVVAFLSGSTFLFGGAAVGALEETLVLFVLAALATFGREIIKDVEDIEGDRSEGLRTLPIAVGERTALAAGSVALVLAASASPIPYLLGTFGLPYLLVVAPAVAIMLYGVWKSWSAPGVGQQLVKAGMYLAILAFIAGRVAVDLG